MDIETQQAEASLKEIGSVMARTRRATAESPVGPILIVWGLVWLVCFLTAQIFGYGHGLIHWRVGPLSGGISAIVWFVGVTVGTVVTMLVSRASRAPVLGPPGLGRRIGLFWFLLFAHVWFWMFLFAPVHGLQTAAFISSAVAFAYVVLGLWFDAPFMLYLGLWITAVTGASYFGAPSYFNLSMAIGGGGALLGSGLYIRLRWA